MHTSIEEYTYTYTHTYMHTYIPDVTRGDLISQIRMLFFPIVAQCPAWMKIGFVGNGCSFLYEYICVLENYIAAFGVVHVYSMCGKLW